MKTPEGSMKTIRGRNLLFLLFCCAILMLGAVNIAIAFGENFSHPGWDFFLRHCEVSSLVEYGIDPFDVFSGTVSHEKIKPVVNDYNVRNDVFDYYWVGGYPPWEYTMMIPLAAMPLKTADAVYKTLEFLALAALLLFSFLRCGGLSTQNPLAVFLWCAPFLLPPAAWNNVFEFGNWSLLWCAGAILLILALNRNRQVVAGFIWAFLMVKPQQAVWFAIPLLFRKQYKAIAVAVLTCLLASVPSAVLCGKSPIAMILEIPGMRLNPFYQTSFFPPPIYQWFDALLFEKAGIAFSALISLLFCLFGTWKLRKERDWFVFLQPTFFAVCAAYPLWPQDILFFYFPLVFLLEIAVLGEQTRFKTRVFAFLVAFCVANPVSWAKYDFVVVSNKLSIETMGAISTWCLLAFLVGQCIVRTKHDCLSDEKSEATAMDCLPRGK